MMQRRHGHADAGLRLPDLVAPCTPGTWRYAVARREPGLLNFGPRERLRFGLPCVAAMAALGALLTGTLNI